MIFVTVFKNSRRAVFPYYRITIGVLSSKPLQSDTFLIITISPEVQITDPGKKVNEF